MHSTGPLAHRHLVHIRPARGQGSSARIHVRIGGCIRDLQKILWCTVHANGNIHLSSPLDVWLRIYWLIDSALPNIQQQPLFHIIVILQVGFTSWRFDGIHLNMIRCRLLRRWKPSCPDDTLCRSCNEEAEIQVYCHTDENINIKQSIYISGFLQAYCWHVYV